jgi:nitrite reductase/ring-hydroxylating ferredoxin subunit
MSFESAKRILSIGQRAALLAAIDRIAATAATCQHVWNPTIRGGWHDGSDVHVCCQCGTIERVTERRGAGQ